MSTKSGKLPSYYSPRISSELPDCSSPLTFDTYSRCSMSCKYCVPKGSGITMVDGTIKKVEDVKVGDVLLGYNEETNNPEATVVLQCMNHEENTYATFKFSDDGAFSTTLNHPIFTKERGWIDARYVEKGMHVLRHNAFAKEPTKSKHTELIFNRESIEGAHKHTKCKGGYWLHSDRRVDNVYSMPEQVAIMDDRVNGNVHFPLIKNSKFRWEQIRYKRTHFKKAKVYNFECWPNNDYCTQSKRNTRKFELDHGVVVSNCFSHSQKDVNPGTKDAPLQGVNPDKLFAMVDGTATSNEAKLFYKHFFKDKFLFHWGGLADSFCHYERKYGTSYGILEGLLERDYPLMFSSKGPAITDDKYVKLFERYAKQNSTAFQFSIVTANDALAKKVEPGVPSSTERFEYMRYLSEMGYWTVLRLRPFIIGITDETLPEILEKAYNAGARAISTEFYALDQRCVGNMRKATERMGKLMGIKDIFKYFNHLSPNERGGYNRLNRLVKEQYVKYMYKFCVDHNMVFACSDPDYKELCMTQNCCFEANTEVLVKRETAPFVYKVTLKEAYEVEIRRKQPFKVMYNGKWVTATTIRVPYENRPWYTIKLRNGVEFTTTEDHINLTNAGEIKSKDLTVGTFLQVVDKPMKLHSNRGDYTTGWFVGMYLAEGSNALDEGPKCIFTIKKDEELLAIITNYVEKLGGYVPSKDKSDRETHYWIQCSSYTVCALISGFVEGTKSIHKKIKDVCFAMSHEFRKGLLYGWLAGDSGTSSSKQLVLDMRDIAVSLGLPVNVSSYERTNKVYSESSNTVHTLNIVNVHTDNKGLKNISYKEDKIYHQTVHDINGVFYSQIVDIQVSNKGHKKYAYCFKVPVVNKFQLANGLVTHNCGLPPNGWHPKDSMNNWSTQQLTAAVMEARINYHKTAELSKFSFNDVYKSRDWIFDEIALSHQDIGCTKYPYAMRKQLTLRHLLQEKWNNLRSYANPRNYFHGKVLPCGVGEDGDILYQYNPSDYEQRWIDEGIDLSYDWRDNHEK